MARQPLTVIVAFIDGWIAQWKVYVPGAVNVRTPTEPGAMRAVLQEPSSIVTVWLVLSLFFQPTTSPTLAVAGLGEKAKPLIVSLTVGAAVETAHAPAAATEAAGAPLGAGVASTAADAPLVVG